MFINRLNRLKKYSERGDTIVEVLVSIGVISLILGGAFVMTNRSLQGTREAQERLNAVKIVEGQIEQIKNMASTDHAALFGSATPATFCIAGNKTLASSDPACSVKTDGTAAGGSTKDVIFKIEIQRQINTFSVKNTWTGLRNGQQNNVQMKYRVY